MRLFFLRRRRLSALCLAISLAVLLLALGYVVVLAQTPVPHDPYVIDPGGGGGGDTPTPYPTATPYCVPLPAEPAGLSCGDEPLGGVLPADWLEQCSPCLDYWEALRRWRVYSDTLPYCDGAADPTPTPAATATPSLGYTIYSDLLYYTYTLAGACPLCGYGGHTDWFPLWDYTFAGSRWSGDNWADWSPNQGVNIVEFDYIVSDATPGQGWENACQGSVLFASANSGGSGIGTPPWRSGGNGTAIVDIAGCGTGHAVLDLDRFPANDTHVTIGIYTRQDTAISIANVEVHSWRFLSYPHVDPTPSPVLDCSVAPPPPDPVAGGGITETHGVCYTLIPSTTLSLSWASVVFDGLEDWRTRETLLCVSWLTANLTLFGIKIPLVDIAALVVGVFFYRMIARL